MNENDKLSFLALLKTMAKYFNQSVGDNVSYLYWDALKGLPWERVKLAGYYSSAKPNYGAINAEGSRYHKGIAKRGATKKKLKQPGRK